MRIIHWIFNLLFPPKCILCGKLLKNGETDLCLRCRMDTEVYPAGKRKLQFLDSFTAVWYYKGYVRRSLLRYKFYRARHFSDGYGRLLAMKLLQDYPEGFDSVTWVPISSLRKLTRGYDQVELLAKATAKELGMEPVPMLKKIRHNRPQSGIRGAEKRRANVLGAYRMIPGQNVEGKRILLLDDILTTGATMGECARVLLTAGAAEVYGAAVAAAQK